MRGKYGPENFFRIALFGEWYVAENWAQIPLEV